MTLILSGIALLFWLALLLLLIRAVWFTVKSKQWPQTNGRITHSSKEAIGNQYLVLFQYEYTVNGTIYTGHLISFLDAFVLFFMSGKYSKRTANHIIAKYPVDTEVTVHYDPNNAKRAALETTLWNNNVVIIAMLLAIMGGVFLLGLGIRKEKDVDGPARIRT